MEQKKTYSPGLTVSSVLACLFGMLLMTMLVQYADLTVAVSWASEHTLALPAVWILVALIAASGGLFALTRVRLLTRAELLCVMYAMLIAAPLTTQGFWHRMVSVTATNPRGNDFEKMDAMSDKLWPHGENLIQDAFRQDNPSITTTGACTWEEIEYEEGKKAVLPVLVNKDKDAVSAVRIKLPLEKDGKAFVVQGEQYLVSVLARATDLGPTANYSCRAYNDDTSTRAALFQSTSQKWVTFLHKKGFVRVGQYGIKFATEAKRHFILEIALEGNGRVELCDPKLFSVAALETLYTGKKVVTESTFSKLSPPERVSVIVKPDHLWSWAGVKYYLAGYIPIAAWVLPVSVWTIFILLILMATLAINIILRNQWLDNERYVMPIARIPASMMDNEGSEDQALPPIWKNRLMWAGFATCFVWMMLKVWHGYDPKVPDVSVKIMLGEYFTDPSWGNMWYSWRYEIEGIFLPLCIFMELNVLLSLVVGYILFRSQYWIGNVTGLTVNPNFPYWQEQTIGAYLGYAAIVLFFTRRYLWRVFKAAVVGDREASAGEALSYRSAFIVLLVTLIGSLLWARWMNIAPLSQLVFFIMLVSFGLVAAKVRAECGTPWGYFSPQYPVLFLGLLGGVWRFGPEAIMFCYVASFMLGPTVFFLIPGAQMELLGLGKRWNVTPRHLVIFTVLGILGGMIIGGWVFLSNAYALSGNACRFSWAFDTKWWYFFPYNQDLTAANNHFLGQMQGAAETGVNPAWWAFGFSAGVTMILAVLRQLFSGFWFHPVGFLLSSTNFMDYVWGSMLTAWVIRSVVLWLGGAATVRTKLQPFFVGVFLGAVTANLVVLILSAYCRSIGIEWSFGFFTP